MKHKFRFTKDVMKRLTDFIRRREDEEKPAAETSAVPETPVLKAFARTDVGKVRAVNQDALVGGVNCEEKHAVELASRLRGLQCHVNLIPLNVVEERDLKGVTEATVRKFMNTLENLHISVTRRREMGDDIEGACGQLRRKTISEGMYEA